MLTRKRSRSAAGLRSTSSLAKRSKRAARSRSTLRSRTSSRLRRSAATSTLTRAIEKWWNRKAEVKMQYYYPYVHNSVATNLKTPTLFTTAITSSAEIYALIPNVSQGNASDQRVGDYVSPRKLIVDLHAGLIPTPFLGSNTEPHDTDPGHLNATSAEVCPEDIIVHIFFLTAKKVKDQTLASSINMDKLLGFDGHQISRFDGTLLNSDKPVNKEEFTVLKKLKFRLRRTNGYPSYTQVAPSGGSPSIQPAWGAAGQANRHFKVSIPMPKRLQYTEPGAVQPENYFPFMVAGWTWANSKFDQTVSNYSPLSIMASTQFYYTDD